MAVAIQVDGLSKSYLISHRAREPYRTLRDAVSRSARNVALALTGRSRPGTETREEFWALQDVSFRIEHGERVGIIGRNGAGKSTLLKILSRITEPTRGRVAVSGRVASLLEVGTGFHPELSGRENIFLNGAVLGMTRAEIRRNFDEIVSFAAVERFLDTPVKRYSSGMHVRLAFSVAAHLNPEILLVDEVLAVGDAQFQKKCLGKMEEVSTSGRTVLFVSHSLPTVLRLCPRTLLFEAGRLKMDGASSEVTQSYLETKPGGSEGHVDLRSASRRGGMGERFRYTGCAVLNSQGQVTDRLLFGEPMTIRVEAEAVDAIDDVGLAVGIDTFSEVRVATLLSEDSGVTFDYGSKCPKVVTAKPEHFALKPGQYYVTLGARHRTQALDQLSQALRFEVDSVPWGDIPPPSAAWGIVHTPARWSISDA
ncbi:MAG TPA: ABC transporter ATP-binding protein [Burkholderiales bacterium]|nr:ABC transporter ATP-binding protein [Burkholderiales bacterium]